MANKKILWARKSIGWKTGDDPDFKWEYSSDKNPKGEGWFPYIPKGSDKDICPHCGSLNTNLLEKNTHECYDCGKTYKYLVRATQKRPPLSRPVSDAKAGYTDRACIKASLGVHGLINIGGYRIQEKDLYTRIIDKIPGAQFHKIIMAIAADLKKENT